MKRLSAHKTRPSCPERRRFLLCGCAAAAGLLASRVLQAAPGFTSVMNLSDAHTGERCLRLYHLHTEERIRITYHRGGHFLPEAQRQLNRFLRDHYSDDVHHIDPHLFDILHDLARSVGEPKAEFQIISGYRSPETNLMLRKKKNGVARKSLHMTGQALDIRLPATKTTCLRDAALKLRRGGVGYYRSSDFIHVDTGRIRRW